ncbi:hypothetical protein ABT354_35900 [Streptomyces sp. NPDC000594]|uniref:hypothetical protein n=1 Tax=Streptomyces sp. NPDC000594 TaxID=3154261 RepID=UPI00331AF74E
MMPSTAARSLPPAARYGRPVLLGAAAVLVAAFAGAAPARAAGTTTCTVNGTAQSATAANNFTITAPSGRNNDIECPQGIGAGDTVQGGSGGENFIGTNTLDGTITSLGTNDTVFIQVGVSATGVVNLGAGTVNFELDGSNNGTIVSTASGIHSVSLLTRDGSNAGLIDLRQAARSTATVTGQRPNTPTGTIRGSGTDSTVNLKPARRLVAVVPHPGNEGTISTLAGLTSHVEVTGGYGTTPGAGNTGVIETGSGPSTVSVTGGYQLLTGRGAAGNTGRITIGQGAPTVTVTGGAGTLALGGDGNASGGTITGGPADDTFNLNGGFRQTFLGSGNTGNAGTVDGGGGTNECDIRPAGTGTVTNCTVS